MIFAFLTAQSFIVVCLLILVHKVQKNKNPSILHIQYILDRHKINTMYKEDRIYNKLCQNTVEKFLYTVIKQLLKNYVSIHPYQQRDKWAKCTVICFGVLYFQQLLPCCQELESGPIPQIPLVLCLNCCQEFESGSMP